MSYHARLMDATATQSSWSGPQPYTEIDNLIYPKQPPCKERKSRRRHGDGRQPDDAVVVKSQLASTMGTGLREESYRLAAIRALERHGSNWEIEELECDWSDGFALICGGQSRLAGWGWQVEDT